MARDRGARRHWLWFVAPPLLFVVLPALFAAPLIGDTGRCAYREIRFSAPRH